MYLIVFFTLGEAAKFEAPSPLPTPFSLPPSSPHRTDVWSMGCLLFAWWHGYSPFESEFTESGYIRVVECSHLRVLSGPASCHTYPNSNTSDNQHIQDLVLFMCEPDIRGRPFLNTVIGRVRQVRLHSSSFSLCSGPPFIKEDSTV